jgi:mycothiol system anti-sigma-R factor
MADCEETLRELYAFLDDELGPEARGAIEAHLNSCTDCFQAFDFHAELQLVIKEKVHDEPPPSLFAKIAELFETDDPGGSHHHFSP